MNERVQDQGWDKGMSKLILFYRSCSYILASVVNFGETVSTVGGVDRGGGGTGDEGAGSGERGGGERGERGRGTGREGAGDGERGGGVGDRGVGIIINYFIDNSLR